MIVRYLESSTLKVGKSIHILGITILNLSAIELKTVPILPKRIKVLKTQSRLLSKSLKN